MHFFCAAEKVQIFAVVLQIFAVFFADICFGAENVQIFAVFLQMFAVSCCRKSADFAKLSAECLVFCWDVGLQC